MYEGLVTAGRINPLILVVDDEMEARLLLRRILEREAMEVVEAPNGRAAFQMAQNLRPDLILLDIQMPELDGFGVVKLLSENSHTTRIPVIVVSAAAREPDDVARGLELGAADYLRKPYNTSELVARVRSNMRSRHLEERLHERTEELEALVRIGSELNQALELDELADRILAATLDQIPAGGAILALIDHAQEATLTRYSGLESPQPGKLLAPESLPAHVLSHGEAAVVNHIDEDQNVTAIFADTPFVAGVATPLKHRGEILGVLALGDSARGRFHSGDLRVLRSIAEQAALAIRNAQLYTELRGYAQALESMVDARTAALQSAQAQLVRAEKLAALGTLAAGVAHEVNNPLQPLRTNLEMALEDLDANRPIDRELLEYAERDVQRIQRIVSRLLDFARPGQPVFERIEINELIEEVLTFAGKQLEHAHVALETHLAAKHRVHGSVDQLKQVFLNLVVNAMEAMPKGGTLIVSTFENEGQLLVAVRDTGSGIAADQLAQVFDPFFTTKADGTGLGLSVSYGIIEGHGGQIEVESVQGEYSLFTVRLPLSTGTSAG